MLKASFCSFNFCGSNTILFSMIIALLLSGMLDNEERKSLGSVLLTVGQVLFMAGIICDQQVVKKEAVAAEPGCFPIHPYHYYTN